MSHDWTILLWLSLAFCALFGIAEIFFHFFKTQAEYTRKIVHIGTGLLTLLFPILLEHFWQVLLLSLSFLVILLVSMRYELLPSINNVERKTSGSPAYPLAVILTFGFFLLMKERYRLMEPLIYFYLPILIMAIADPVAALVGTALKKKNSGNTGKSFRGTAAFFLTALFISLNLGILFRGNLPFVWFAPFAILVSVATAFVERVSRGGWDNLTIPLTAVFLLLLLTLLAS